MKILGISGSLRTRSINTALLEAMQTLAPAEIELRLALSIGELPHFNPDLESALPATVIAWHDQIGWADALVISSPPVRARHAGQLEKRARLARQHSPVHKETHCHHRRYKSRVVRSSILD